MIRSATILTFVCVTACSPNGKSPPSDARGTNNNGVGGQSAGTTGSAGNAGISGGGATDAGLSSDSSVSGADGSPPRGPILYWDEQAGTQRWLATGTFSAKGTVTTASDKTLSIDINDSSGESNLQAFIELDGAGGFMFEIFEGVYAVGTYDRIRFGTEGVPIIAPQTYGEPTRFLDGGAIQELPGFTLLYDGKRVTDAEEFQATFAEQDFSMFSVTLSKWDAQARVLEASFHAVGADNQDQTLNLDGSISLAAQGEPCDTAMFACQAMFE
ncbi:MAG TPA: hypothetical protein VK745_03075 [Polyangiaceae bacterium]|nr:hypothetical protein [Polyangiaceae bacterium]